MSAVPPPPLWLLALLTFSGTVAMHVFVPALPQAAADLHAGAGAMQLTVSFYILGLAVGQLIYGPVSDRFGRRPVLMVGLVIYTLGGLGALAANSVPVLVAARLFQALGGCAGLVLGRAIARDGTSDTDATRRLALMNLMVVAGPGLAPLLGSALSGSLGWRSIFVALCGLGVCNLLLTWRLLPETVPRGAGQATGAVLRNYGRLLGSLRFLGYAVGGGCATTAMYAFIGVAPFIFVGELHRPAGEVGFYLAANILGLWLGSLCASRLAGRVATRRTLVWANLGSTLGAACFLLGAWTGSLSVPLVVGSMAVFTFGAGIASPAALVEAMSVNPLATGSASGLYGATQMAIGALCTALAGLGGDPALAASLVLVAAGLVAQLAFLVAERRRPVG